MDICKKERDFESLNSIYFLGKVITEIVINRSKIKIHSTFVKFKDFILLNFTTISTEFTFKFLNLNINMCKILFTNNLTIVFFVAIFRILQNKYVVLLLLWIIIDTTLKLWLFWFDIRKVNASPIPHNRCYLLFLGEMMKLLKNIVNMYMQRLGFCICNWNHLNCDKKRSINNKYVDLWSYET